MLIKNSYSREQNKLSPYMIIPFYKNSCLCIELSGLPCSISTHFPFISDWLDLGSGISHIEMTICIFVLDTVISDGGDISCPPDQTVEYVWGLQPIPGLISYTLPESVLYLLTVFCPHGTNRCTLPTEILELDNDNSSALAVIFGCSPRGQTWREMGESLKKAHVMIFTLNV